MQKELRLYERVLHEELWTMLTNREHIGIYSVVSLSDISLYNNVTSVPCGAFSLVVDRDSI